MQETIIIECIYNCSGDGSIKIAEVSQADLDQTLTNPDGSVVTLSDALIAPTKIYVKPVLELLESGHIDGLAHITGGGLTENIVRILPDDTGLVIHTNAWERPAVFDWLQANGNIEEAEMLRTFNCGIGMVMLVAEEKTDSMIEASVDAGLICRDIGYVTKPNQTGSVEYTNL